MFKFDDFSVRALGSQDKELILHWRNQERVRKYMYSDHIISSQEHELWFQRTLNDPTACFLIFQYRERPIGLISFTKISKTHGTCSWAFYLGETDVPKGTGSIMEFFALDYAFTSLAIRKLCCEVFVFNTGVIKMHEKFGFLHEGRFSEHYIKNGKPEDIVCLAKFGTKWNEEREEFKAHLSR